MIVRVTTHCVCTGVYDKKRATSLGVSTSSVRIATQRPKVVCRGALRKTHPLPASIGNTAYTRNQIHGDGLFWWKRAFTI